MSQKNYTLWVAIGFLVFACSKAPAPDVMALMLPLEQAGEVQRIQHKSVLLPDQRGVGAQSPEDMAVLQQRGITSSAYFKYWLNEKQAYKVRINVYSDKATRDAAWDLRYPADTLTATQSAGVGERSFVSADKIAAFVTHTALVEIVSSKGAPDLGGFLRRYAAFVESRY